MLTPPPPRARVVPRSRLRGDASLAPLHDRINQLEGLVRGLLHQPLEASPAAFDSHVPPPSESELVYLHDSGPLRLGKEEIESDAGVPAPVQDGPSRATGHRASSTSSSRSSRGDSVTIRKSGGAYVSSAHWKALLDSISGLREHIDEVEAEAESSAQSPSLTINAEHEIQPPSPLLFYSYHLCSSSTPSLSTIIDSIPSRPVVDRLVTLYFNEIDFATGKLGRNGVPNHIKTIPFTLCVFTK